MRKRQRKRTEDEKLRRRIRDDAVKNGDVRAHVRIAMGEPHRDLVAAILQRAADDCENEGPLEAVPAYRWIIHRDKWFVIYCNALDIDPGQFRDRVIAKSGARCERMLREILGRREEREAA